MNVVDKMTEIDWRRALALDDGVRELRQKRAAASARNWVGRLFLCCQLDGAPALVADTKPASEAIGTGDLYGCFADFLSGGDQQDGEAVIAGGIRVVDFDLSPNESRQTRMRRSHGPLPREPKPTAR